MMKSRLLVVSLFLGSLAAAAVDPYGGDARLTGSNTDGYFRVEKIDGRYWLVTPDNHGFFSLAHTTTLYQDNWGGYCPPLDSYPNPYGNRAKYNNDYSAWVTNLLTRMDRYGFNSLGAWGQSNIAELTECVRVLFVTNRASSTGCRMAPGGFPDVWDPLFHDACVNRATSLSGNSTNPYTIGAFPDNELHWNGTAVWTADGEPLAELFIDFPAEASGKQYFANTFLQSRYASVTDLNTAWGTSYSDWSEVLNMTSADIPDNATHPARFDDKLDFTEAIADQYYSQAAGTMRAADPNHLVFSARWALWTAAYRDDAEWERHARYAERVWKKAGEYCDVFALNSYIDFEWLEINYSLLTRLFQNVGRPVMITEWATFADDTAFAYNPGWNRYQKNRAEYYEKQIKYLLDLELPNDPNDGQPADIIVGTQWFQFYDEPSLGRTDLEKMNFGLYNVKDEAYLTCLDHVRSVNLQAYDRLIDASPITILESPDQILPGPQVQNPRPTFQWGAVPGAASYTLLYSPEKCFPESQTVRVEGLTDLAYQPAEPLTSGRWYWCVSALDGSGLYGMYADPIVFDVTGVDYHLETRRYLKMEDLSAWRHVALEDGGWDASVYAFPDSATKTEGNFAARVVFTVNSLNKETGLKNAATDEAALAYVGPRLNFKDENQIYFDLMPARVVDASGVMTVASKYLRFRMKNRAGETLVDEPIDPSGSLPALQWSRIEFPLADVDRSWVTTVEFSVSCAQEALPWDQRITVWLDNFGPDPITTSVGGWVAR